MNEEKEINKKAATAIVSEAEAVAKTLVDTASRTAARLIDHEEVDKRNTESLSNALREVFGEYEDQRRFIDVKRIPLICQNINNMHDDMKELKDLMKENKERYITIDQFSPYKRVLNIIGGAVVLSLVGAVLSLIILK